jgi:hypothetical protein
MAFVLHGCDAYGSEVDDRGIDMVVRSKVGNFHEIQVKSVHKSNYIFLRKDKFELRDKLWVAVVRFVNGEEPQMFLIPAEAWKDPEPPFSSRDFEGKQLKPEWGLSMAKKHAAAMEEFEFEQQIVSLL